MSRNSFAISKRTSPDTRPTERPKSASSSCPNGARAAQLGVCPTLQCSLPPPTDRPSEASPASPFPSLSCPPCLIPRVCCRLLDEGRSNDKSTDARNQSPFGVELAESLNRAYSNRRPLPVYPATPTHPTYSWPPAGAGGIIFVFRCGTSPPPPPPRIIAHLNILLGRLLRSFSLPPLSCPGMSSAEMTRGGRVACSSSSAIKISLLSFRYQFFLQLKQDILTERLECAYETAVQLSSLALQCEYLLWKPN